MDIEALFKTLWSAVESGNWWAVTAAGLAIAVFWARKALARRWPWIASDRGGVLSLLVGGTLGGVAIALLGGQALGLGVVFAAAKVAFTAAGGFSVLRKLIWPDKDPVPTVSLRPTVFVPSASGGVPQAVDREDPKR